MARETERIELVAEQRTATGKQVQRLRREGWVPAIMYGHGFDPVPLQFEERSLAHVLPKVSGSQLVSVNIKGNTQPEMALVRDVQRDPIRGNFLHVDFYHVMMTERLTAEVPLVLVGESPVIEARQGILLQGVSSIEVECLPGDLVDAIEVDLSDLLEIDQAIHVRDLAVPAGIEVLTDLDDMIVRVVPLEAEEVEEVEALEPSAAEVEVITEAREREAAGE